MPINKIFLIYFNDEELYAKEFLCQNKEEFFLGYYLRDNLSNSSRINPLSLSIQAYLGRPRIFKTYQRIYYPSYLCILFLSEYIRFAMKNLIRCI